MGFLLESIGKQKAEDNRSQQKTVEESRRQQKTAEDSRKEVILHG